MGDLKEPLSFHEGVKKFGKKTQPPHYSTDISLHPDTEIHLQPSVAHINFEVPSVESEIGALKYKHVPAFKKHAQKSKFARNAVMGDYNGDDSQLILYFNTDMQFNNVFWRFFNTTQPDSGAMHSISVPYILFEESFWYDQDMYSKMIEKNPRNLLVDKIDNILPTINHRFVDLIEDLDVTLAVNQPDILESMIIDNKKGRILDFETDAYFENDDSCIHIYMDNFDPDFIREILTHLPKNRLTTEEIDERMSLTEALYNL
ncbi:hypothetical protein GOV11_01275 [Candidatus Woesearchaeota archaeon]|nr:hypothetical protein [Candidatus Woesearchaeota archaeon]